MIRINSRTAAVAAAIVMLPAVSACGINTIPTREEAAKARWADVQAQYQRRAELIPNLVATRATPLPGTPATLPAPAAFQRYQAAQGELSQALSRLLLTVERYPEVKSNQNFLALQSQLEGTENRIAVARRDYNQAVQDYNTSLRTFPTVIWASTIHGGSKPMALFSATEAAQSAPSVSFDVGAGAGAAPGSPPPAAK